MEWFKPSVFIVYERTSRYGRGGILLIWPDADFSWAWSLVCGDLMGTLGAALPRMASSAHVVVGCMLAGGSRWPALSSCGGLLGVCSLGSGGVPRRRVQVCKAS